MMEDFQRDPGSFRDPSGYVFASENRVIRTITAAAETEFAELYENGVLQSLVERRCLIDTRKINADAELLKRFSGARGEPAMALYEHPRIPFITYPYEWVFSQLKAAALTHLEAQIIALKEGYAFSDASAYNMQFLDGRPVHIDPLSLRKYEEGEVWYGYNQFCRQFLLPLLIEAWSGQSFQPIYRGSLDGISFGDALAALPKHRLFLNPSAFLHVYVHGRSVLSKSSSGRATLEGKALPKQRYMAILEQMRDFVSGLVSGKRSGSYWKQYAYQNSYSEKMRSQKFEFVKRWAARELPQVVWDIGGNTGDYSRAALEGGAHQSILFDSDQDAIEAAFRNRADTHGQIYPVLMDIGNPSPDMGWRQSERQGLNVRISADGVIALAIIHHMIISNNLPLKEVIEWLIGLAPIGVLEFIPKNDPMVLGLLAHRQDVYGDYTEENFRALVTALAKINDEYVLEENGRLLISYNSL